MAFTHELLENIRAFLHMHRMNVSPNWPADRVDATLEAYKRICRYEDERAGRMAVYLRGGATQSYTTRWRDKRVVLNPDRFSRALGER